MRRYGFILASLLQVVVSFHAWVPLKHSNDAYAYCSCRHMKPSDLNNEISTSDLPVNINNRSYRNINKSLLSISLALITTVISSAPVRADSNRDEYIYTDPENGFSVMKLPGWAVMPKQPPTISLQKMQPEEVIFVASSFLEGASLRVTKTSAGRLLKDFNIDWWFAPLNSMSDVGSPELVSKLLSLQHQGVNEKRGLPERVFSSTYVSDSEFEKRDPPEVTNAVISKNILSFEYLTPLAGTTCKTVSKAYYRSNDLIVVWISALASVWDGEYGEQLKVVLDSFVLEDIKK